MLLESVTDINPQDLGVSDSPTFAGLTLSGLDANKVVYADGSKALSTTSLLAFDGTHLGVGIAVPTEILHIYGICLNEGGYQNSGYITSSLGGAATGLFAGSSNASFIFSGIDGHGFQIQSRTVANVLSGTPQGSDSIFEVKNSGNVKLGKTEHSNKSITFDSNVNVGIFTWMDDEDYFLFGDSIKLGNNEPLIFGDSNEVLIDFDPVGNYLEIDCATNGVNTGFHITTDGDANTLDINGQYGTVGIGIAADSSIKLKVVGDVLISTTSKLHFYDTAIGIYSQADTFLDLFADGAVRIGDSAAGAPSNYVNFASTGDLTFVGSSGLAYGSMYTNADIDVTLTVTSQWYEIDAAQAWTEGKRHNCTFADPKITVTYAGTYLITYTVSASCNANAQEIEFGIMIDSTNTDGPAHGSAGVQSEGRAHRLFPANDVGHMSGHTIIQLAAGKTVSLASRNTTSADDTVSVEHGNLTVTQIAGGSA